MSAALPAEPSLVNLSCGRAGNTYVEALAMVAAHHHSWLRPLEAWRSRTHNARRQFGSLLRHLFARFDDVPRFFDAAWFAGRSNEAAEHREWFLHVGQGRNIRHCRLPICPIGVVLSEHARQVDRKALDVGALDRALLGHAHGIAKPFSIQVPLERGVIDSRPVAADHLV